MKFSVIIPTRNSSKTISQVVDAVLNANLLANEIIIVDDGSDDNINDFLIGYPCKIYSLGNHFGAAYARNFGAQKAQNDYLVFIDSDVVVSKNYLNIIKEELSTDTDVVGGSYLQFNPKNNSFHRLACLQEELFWEQLAPRSQTPVVYGGLCGFKKSVWHSPERSYLENKLFAKMASGEDCFISEELATNYNIIYRSDLTGIHKTDYSKRYFTRMFNQGYSRTTNILNRPLRKINHGLLGSFRIPYLILSYFIFLVSPIFWHWSLPPLGLLFLIYALFPLFKKISIKDYPLMTYIFITQQLAWVLGSASAIYRPLKTKIINIWALAQSGINFLFGKKMSKLFFFVTNRCNMTCSWCLDANRPGNNLGAMASQELSSEEVLRICQSSREKISYLIITGGEPF